MKQILREYDRLKRPLVMSLPFQIGSLSNDKISTNDRFLTGNSGSVGSASSSAYAAAPFLGFFPPGALLFLAPSYKSLKSF